jgi:L-fucose isomerase-like protein
MTNRLIGRLPKVGIRPVIDGRGRGIRESLEEQTMNMARAAAKLFVGSMVPYVRARCIWLQEIFKRSFLKLLYF